MADDLDFSLAFVEVEAQREQASAGTGGSRLGSTGRKASLEVPTRMVRVMLARNVGKSTLYSIGSMSVPVVAGKRLSCEGRIAVTASKQPGRITLATSAGKFLRVALPCTLLAHSFHNYFELGDKSYRNSVILTPGAGVKFSVVNYCGVEQYLRGVVPLEIGKRPGGEIEAVKAQAVAARTYTYKRIAERRGEMYDVVATVADQVYGGTQIEDPISDGAIRATADIVMTYRDSLIYAYYHSTCGGTTANVEDVWDKPAAPYLRSRRDTDNGGKAYCAASRYFTWKVTWPAAAFSSILLRYGTAAFPAGPAIKGSVREIEVTERYACGRVAACRIRTSSGSVTYGGDRIRFAMRRDVPDRPILWSSRFEVVAGGPNRIELAGRGYGHGVGMCQMGAIGRARAGQSYEQILRAYYTGIGLSKVEQG